MFSLTFPAALWGLAAIPVVWLAAWFGRTSFGRPQRILQAAIRSLLVAALALALAGPIWSRPSSRISVVYLVDVSHSIASASLTGAADWIDGMNARVRPAETRVLAFGTRGAAHARGIGDERGRRRGRPRRLRSRVRARRSQC